jgi:hypothetical protein
LRPTEAFWRRPRGAAKAAEAVVEGGGSSEEIIEADRKWL